MALSLLQNGEKSGMQLERPLLTIAIPTYNRSELLDQMLSILHAEVLRHPDVEILISDNGSIDDTPAIVQRYLDSGWPNIHYQRHAENIGPDANFVSCFDNAQGRYFWLCSDDDIIIEGALDRLLEHLHDQDYDIIYATSYSFSQDYIAEYQGDALERHYHSVVSAHQFALIVNIMFTFISGIIVNKERLDQLPHESPSNFIGTNLIQLSWALPLLCSHRRSLVLWQRVVAARGGNAGGYSFGQVWGERLSGILKRLLSDNPHLVQIITNVSLRRWFPSAVYNLRHEANQRCHLEDAPNILKKFYGSNFRYWLFTYPIFKLPLPLARIWVRAGAIVNKLLYVLWFPNFWRKEIR
jgi:abequosyltransferase